MRRSLIASALLALLVFASRPAFAVRREVIRLLQSEYAGHTYQLREDLRGTNYLFAPNVLDERGIRYRGKELRVLFGQMETVYLDRVSSDGERAVLLTLYRSRNDARQIRGSIPAAPLPVGPDRSITLGNFARDLSTSVTLELSAGKEKPEAQREQVIALLDRLFYLKQSPSYPEKEAFILSHSELPVTKLVELTGLAEEIVLGILKRSENR